MIYHQQMRAILKNSQKHTIIFALISVFMLLGFNVAAATQTIPASFADLVEKVRPAVVTISTTQKSTDKWPEFFRRRPFPEGSPFDDFFRRFFDFDFEDHPFRKRNEKAPHPKMSSQGSGFIIDADGLVVTNHHVIEAAKEITVTLNDGSEHSATVLGHDAKTDLALLKIEANKPLSYISFGDSDKARVGDWVIAVGNPFGLGGTFTAGIISARGRDIQSGPYDDFIQIDAPINKGNSGGPLLNMDGKVIGINTAIYSPNGGNIGIGFAVPASMAMPVIEQLHDKGNVERGWLGVQIQSVTQDIAESLGMKEANGALVVKVLPDSPAERAGILSGDVIIEVEDQMVENAKALSRTIANAKAGESVQLSVWRHGAKKTLNVHLGRMSGEEMATLSPGSKSQASSVLGLALAEMTRSLRQQYQLSDEMEGVVIIEVETESAAENAGLQAGDVIMMINQKPVSTPDKVVQAVEQAKSAKRHSVLLLISRKGMPRFVTVRIDT